MQQNEEQKRLKYSDMKEMLDTILDKFNLSGRCDVFEETLLKMAGITSEPTACQFSMNNSTQGALTNFDLGITYVDANKFYKYFRDHYNDQSASMSTENTVTIKGQSTIFIRLDSHILATKVLPDFENKLKEMALTHPGIIEDYKTQCNPHLTRYVSYDDFVGPLMKLGNKLGLDASKTDFIEETFLILAGITSPTTTCRFQPSKSPRKTDFYLGISVENAEKFRDFFNAISADSAVIIEEDVKLPDKGELLLQRVRIDNKILKDLYGKFSAMLYSRLITEPDAIELYRKASGVLPQTTKEIIAILDTVFTDLVSKLPKRNSTCYLDENNRTAPKVPSLMESIYKSGVLAGQENAMVANSATLFKNGEILKYKISLPNRDPDNNSETIELEEMRPNKDGAATLKLTHAVSNLRQAIANKLPLKEIADQSEKLTQAIHFYSYACNSPKERAEFKNKYKASLKKCQKDIEAIYEKNANPDHWAIKESSSARPPSYFDQSYNSYSTPGPGMRC
ncbi:MAG: hypothetical protein H0U71_04960 [Gammaproteobacteria bacterium]|nr:hypothetical protein [Gammaproteobacteria bacterium]